MYCASFLRPSASPARTRTPLCTEKPLWRQPSMLADGVLGYKKLKNFRTKSLFEQFYGNCRQRDEHPIGAKQSVGGQHMDVRVEGHQIAKCLYEQNQPRTAFHLRAGIGLEQQSLHDMAQLPEQCAPARKDRPQHARYGEDVLPVSYGRKNVLPDPIPIGEHPLLVAARAEISRL